MASNPSSLVPRPTVLAGQIVVDGHHLKSAAQAAALVLLTAQLAFLLAAGADSFEVLAEPDPDVAHVAGAGVDSA